MASMMTPLTDFCIPTNNSSLALHEFGYHEKDWKTQLLVTIENEVQVLSRLDNTKGSLKN